MCTFAENLPLNLKLTLTIFNCRNILNIKKPLTNLTKSNATGSNIIIESEYFTVRELEIELNLRIYSTDL
jgi:hypothetical protein